MFRCFNIIERAGTCIAEIKREIAIGKIAVTNLTKVWRDKHIKLETKMRLLETLVFSIELYGSDSQIINKSERKRVDSSELWCYMKVLRILGTERKINVEIVRMIIP